MAERSYKCLNTDNLFIDGFELVPIRDLDKIEIMHWRNQQIKFLRQSKLLNEEQQNHYFKTTVAALFNIEYPEQFLFSFLHNGVLCGYGGLVHINWEDRNAEISLLIKTELEKDNFAKYWSAYLSILFKIAFEKLNFHKIYTYAFDLRPHLYEILILKGFIEEARLKQHCFYDGEYLDVLIHSKFREKC